MQCGHTIHITWMGDPSISELLCVGWFWPFVGTLNLMHCGVPLYLVLVGLLPLAVAGVQMAVSGAGGPSVCLWWWGPCFGLSVWSGEHWGILARRALRLSGTD